MSLVKSENERKWINLFIALCALVIVYISIKFFLQMGDWFDLEARISYFAIIHQFIAVLIGIVSFVVAVFHKKLNLYLSEVYQELSKVVWPEKDAVIKMTIGIVIAIVICSSIFVSVDLISNKILHLFY